MSYQLSRRSIDRLKGVDQVLIDILKEAITDSPFDFGIPQDGGKRTAARQNELYNLKKSKCDGYIKKSRHQSGKAFDIYAYVDGKASWDKNHLLPIAKHIQDVAKKKGVSLVWGGNWGDFTDLPHFEIA